MMMNITDTNTWLLGLDDARAAGQANLLLSLRKGTTLTKEMFLNHLYGGMDEPELKIIDVFICKLRKKLSTATGGDNYIETVWGRGYVLRDPQEDQMSGGHRMAVGA